ncbi:hypothetical protein AOL_s00043g512 [Orbilia oligospora ATCC 24927]|uniref:Major facilitator superfamily (MFS) profile domain-containing protein n=1 Tax=Arthrobotrys oligospora (strain ATCC 24927 / CBS 115.81 / DSM 1491) TaxID=756982 RepID=G1X488_ARTOA|nr:hypothetical protein AOL_s00043g512 [Orbilia oligospora ATCC 24927]EGX52122.1 hypothetical protein AOL_s00043g512 [Orbilia oligospora ATCC 24927]
MEEKKESQQIEFSKGSNADDTENQHPDGGAEEFHWNLPIFLNLLALFACYFSSTWALIVPSASIPFIVARFPQQARIAAWIAASVSIPNCVLQAFMGELSDILGRKPFLITGMLFGTAGTLISSRANDLEMVIAGQVLNGVGLTLGYLAIPLVAEVVPKDKRPMLQGIAGIIAGLASIAGPIIQGAFIKHNVGGVNEGWRAGFYMSAGFFAMTLVLLVLFYHPATRPSAEGGMSVSRRILEIDWLGVFLVASGLVLFLVGLQYGGNPYPWTSARVLCTLIIGAVLLISFGFYNGLIRKDGILYHALFEHRNFAICQVLSFVGGFVLFGGQAYLPQEITNLFTRDAVLTGVYNLPFNFLSIVGSFGAGAIMGKTKEAKTLVVVSFVLFLVGSGLMAVMQPHINFAAWFFPTAILGMAVGASTLVLAIVVSLCTPNEYIAHAMSLLASSCAFGGSIGITIFEQVFSSKEKDILPGKISTAVLDAGLPSGSLEEFLIGSEHGITSALLNIPGVSPVVLEAGSFAMVQGLADSYRFIWYSLIPFAFVTLVLAFFLTSTKAQMTRQVAAGIKH